MASSSKQNRTNQTLVTSSWSSNSQQSKRRPKLLQSNQTLASTPISTSSLKNSIKLEDLSSSRDQNHHQEDEQEEPEKNVVEPSFQTALHIVQSSLPRAGPIQPTYNDKLLLYSLFKQAVIGDASSSAARPGMFDMLGRAKWDAWKAREGLSSLEAKKLYIESVLKILRSHCDRPEARKLIESLHSYEVYSAQVDQMSGSEEDLDSANELIINSSDEDPTHYRDERSNKDRIRGNQNQTAESKSSSEGDIKGSRLGPYMTSSQLPDPVKLPDCNQLLPPHSPRTNHSQSERSYNSSNSSSLAEDDHSSSPQRSLEEHSNDESSDRSIESEPKFTHEQVKTLIELTPQPLHSSSQAIPTSFNSHAFQASNSPHLFPPPPGFSGDHTSSYEVLISNIQKLNQSIDNLYHLISESERLNLSTTRSFHQVTPHVHPADTQSSGSSSSHNHKLFSLARSFINRLRVSPFFTIWFKRFLFDISIFVFLFKFVKYFKSKIKKNWSLGQS